MASYSKLGLKPISWIALLDIKMTEGGGKKFYMYHFGANTRKEELASVTTIVALIDTCNLAKPTAQLSFFFCHNLDLCTCISHFVAILLNKNTFHITLVLILQ